jgi:hypothetical protein
MNNKIIELPKKANKLTSKNSSLTTPKLDSMFESAGIPGLPPIKETDAEVIANQEVDDIMRLIRENRRSYAESFRDIESGEFWFCVCFQSRSQKEEFINSFLNKFASDKSIDEFGDRYVSGLDMAEMLNIPITPIVLKVKKSRLAPKSLRKLEVIN